MADMSDDVESRTGAKIDDLVAVFRLLTGDDQLSDDEIKDIINAIFRTITKKTPKAGEEE